MQDSEDNIRSWGQDHKVGSNQEHDRAARSRKEAVVLLGNVNVMAEHTNSAGDVPISSMSPASLASRKASTSLLNAEFRMSFCVSVRHGNDGRSIALPDRLP